MIDLCTRGRKRGFGAVLATQRLSKLHKDAAAELNNKLIGRTGLDVDVKRAADELGFGKERWRELRELEPGEFFMFGPALTREVQKARIGPVQTTHPKAGARLSTVAPPATAAIRALLPKLSDLPAEQERKARTEAELQKEIRSLRAQLSAAEKRAPAAPAPNVREVPVLKDAQIKRVEGAAEKMRMAGDRAVQFGQTAMREAAGIIDLLRINLRALSSPRHAPMLAATKPVTVAAMRPISAPTGTRGDGNGDGHLGRGEKAVLTAIAQHADGVDRQQLTILTGYKRSTRDAYLQRVAALVEWRGERVFAAAAGIEALGSDFQPLPTGDELREHWLRRLPEGERRVFVAAIQEYPSEASRERVSEETGYKRSTRDAYIQRLAARRLIDVTRDGVRASEMLFG